MYIDLEKLRKLSSNRNVKSTDIDEESFKNIHRIYDTVVDSECYDTTIKYLSAINDISVYDLKFIVKFYYDHFASEEERKLYIEPNYNYSKSEGFANISMISSILLLISTFGILIASILYNL